jgi:hypothetical protein
VLNDSEPEVVLEIQQCPASKPPGIVDEKGFLAS